MKGGDSLKKSTRAKPTGLDKKLKDAMAKDSAKTAFKPKKK